MVLRHAAQFLLCVVGGNYGKSKVGHYNIPDGERRRVRNATALSFNSLILGSGRREPILSEVIRCVRLGSRAWVLVVVRSLQPIHLL